MIHNPFSFSIAWNYANLPRIETRMRKKLLFILIPILCLMVFPSAANAATITSCTLNKEKYNQGQVGYIKVEIFNDDDDKIRVVELTARMEYYYSDGNVYLQTFYTNATLPSEIEQGQSDKFSVPFSLPTNIAPGYTDFYVRARTETWNRNSEAWLGSEYPYYYQKIYIESPYKEELDNLQFTNYQLQEELAELQAINNGTTTVMYFLAATTIIFAVIMMFVIFLNRRTRVLPQPAP